MELTTSLRLCREHDACGVPGSPVEGVQYPLLVSALGPDWGDDQPIPLTMLLDLDAGSGWTGPSNTIWALRAVPPEQAEARDRVADNFCVQMLGAIPGPPEHAHAVQVLQAFTRGLATIEDVQKAAGAAWDAWVAWAARDAGAAWAARDAGAAWAARATWDAWVARGAGAAGAAGAAWAVGDAWTARDAAILRWLLEEEASHED